MLLVKRKFRDQGRYNLDQGASKSPSALDSVDGAADDEDEEKEEDEDDDGHDDVDDHDAHAASDIDDASIDADAGSDANARDNEGQTLLSSAALEGHAGVGDFGPLPLHRHSLLQATRQSRKGRGSSDPDHDRKYSATKIR